MVNKVPQLTRRGVSSITVLSVLLVVGIIAGAAIYGTMLNKPNTVSSTTNSSVNDSGSMSQTTAYTSQETATSPSTTLGTPSTGSTTSETATAEYGNAAELYHGPTAPVGVAVDGHRTAYRANYDTSRLLSLAKGASSQSVVPGSLNHPSGVAVDSSGDLYYGEYFSYTVSELSLGSSTPKLLFNAGTCFFFISVDSKGNIYVVTGAGCNGQASNANVPDSILRWNRTTARCCLTTAGSTHYGLTIDDLGDLFYTDNLGGSIWEVPVSTMTQTTSTTA